MILETIIQCVCMFGIPWVVVLLIERCVLLCPKGDGKKGGGV